MLLNLLQENFLEQLSNNRLSLIPKKILHPMITNYLSNKLKFFSFLLIVMVVVLHSQNVYNRIGGFNETEGLNYILQNIISGGICAVAVPMFFCISGFLFFYSGIASPIDYIDKIKKRFKTLVIPYVLTSAFAIIFYFLLQIPESTRKFFYNKLIINYSISELLETLLFNPLAYQLWFLRNLIIIILLTPLIYFLIKKLKLIYIIPLTLCWIILSNKTPYNILPTLYFFSIGAYFAINNLKAIPFIDNLTLKRTLLIISITGWIALILIRVIFLSETHAELILNNLSILFGIIALWLLYDLSINSSLQKIKPIIKPLIAYSFFIYLFHEPILTMTIKLAFAILGKNTRTSIICYYSLPPLVIYLTYYIGMLTKYKLPFLYNLLTGNR
ncbi:putative acyltransferase [Solitalea canadensis DSM 3403]|uniref:Putative acyltransferase n=2 Tax=Solitalea canadensis TaxID=995 RepID=H8KSA3_SOLCM|nr:putative acyltransferase [Solitalea canadensis DSM 3403]